jgi:predicted PurR-regulated permease PerM
MEYINENCTAVTIETDVYQTYMFDIVKKACFVEREHTNDDTLGNNTVPEGLDTGEYIVNSVDSIGYETSGNPETRVVIGVTKVPEQVYSQMSTTSRTYNGILNGLTYYVFETNTDAANFINAMDLSGLADNIVNVFLAPNKLCNTSQFYTYTISILDFGSVQIDISFSCNKIPSESTARILKDSTSISINSTLNGYAPKNNKMFTKEFNYLHITNNNGSDVNLAYEDFINNSPSVRVIGAICPGCSIRLIPENYKKYNTSSNKNVLMEYGLVAGKYPVCSWSNDTYTNWLTSNTVNIGFKALGGILGIVGGGALLATGAGATVGGGMLAGGVGMITDTIKEIYNHSLVADQASGNTNSGDVTFSSGMNKVVAYKMNIRNEYARVIDEFMSMFGYKVNRVKIPNITGRTNWNFVKTIDCNIHAFIPQKDCIEIKNMFNESGSASNIISNILNYIINGAADFIGSIISSFVTIFTSIIFSIYILGQKEYLIRGTKKVMYVIMNKEQANKLINIGSIANTTFSKFVSGQLVDAIILGLIIFITSLIFRFPYALIIAVLTTITALIPIFGALIAMVLGALLIAITNPVQALIFIIVFLVIQQIEGNFIYPKIVGKSVGLSPMWTLLAITVGGNLFGIPGMLIGLPLASIAYALVKEIVNNKLKDKKIEINN